MKRILYTVLSAFMALSVVSCNMELFPYDSLEITEGMKTFDDAVSYRVSIYSPLKSFVCGLRETLEDTRSDLFNAKGDFGNFYGRWHSWQTDVTEQEAKSVWFNNYAIIGNVNFAIDSYTDLLDNSETIGLTKSQADSISLFRAEAYMVRAMAYLDLATKFCKAYTEDYADTPASGVPLPTTYAPTSDASAYPERATLNETYSRILDDITEAMFITTPGKQNSHYFSVDAVLALRARVYLYMGKYDLAQQDANAVINSGIYSLASDLASIRLMWDGDTSPENIMRVSKTDKDTGSQSGGFYYIFDQSKNDGTTPNPQYLPTQDLLDLYDEGDWRYDVYFETHSIKSGYNKADMEVFYKFKGNPALRSDSNWNYVHMGKPFRLAEMYLIAAESCVELGLADQAVYYLDVLRKSRIENFTATSYGGSIEVLRQEIREERAKELVGEGFRMHDLKRWNLGMVRGKSQNPSMTHNTYDGISRQAGDFRFLWPIPKAEIDANPQIKNQQNPGY